MTPAPSLVSIVIPTFNRAHMIGDAVRSCGAQTYAACEIIVVDDGSSDDTADALIALSREVGGKLRVVHQENAGASSARNSGLDVARGEFVQFLDSDDLLAPSKISLQIAALEANPNAEAALCYGRLEREGAAERVGLDLGQHPMAYIEALCGRVVHIVPTPSPLWRRSFLNGPRRWNPSISLGDDLEFHVQCLADAQGVAFVPQELFTIRDHQGDRLSNFSVDNRRLAALLLTRECIYDSLVTREKWSCGCARNSIDFMRTLYANYLRRMTDEDIARLEASIIKMMHPSPIALLLWLLIGLRRSFGRARASAMVKWALGIRQKAP